MGDKPKVRKSKFSKVSFAFHVTSTFALISVMTAVLMAAVAFMLWNMGRGRLFSEEDTLLAMAIAVVISVVLSAFLGAFFAQDIIKPVERIAKTANAIKEGDLGARTYLTGEDEMGQLGQTFDEMAESLERDRDLEHQLIGDVAHELRTPLMAIQATVEAIQDGVLPADEARLSTISSETRRLSRLVDALLHLNRLENGTIVAKQNPVVLSELLADLALNHQMLIESAGLEFGVHIDPDVRIVGDKDLLNQAVANLLSNAVRYTPEGGRISLVCTRSRRNACISVTDTGIGISDEDQQKVFSRFWRADAARDRASGGLGIGLALVKEVVDQHHGRISVESELGSGSSFTICIPLAADDASIRAAMPKSELRRLAKAAKREQERQRKEQERLARAESSTLRGTTGAIKRVFAGKGDKAAQGQDKDKTE